MEDILSPGSGNPARRDSRAMLAGIALRWNQTLYDTRERQARLLLGE